MTIIALSEKVTIDEDNLRSYAVRLAPSPAVLLGYYVSGAIFTRVIPIDADEAPTIEKQLKELMLRRSLDD